MLEIDDLLKFEKPKVPHYATVRLNEETLHLIEQLKSLVGTRKAAEIVRRSIKFGAEEALKKIDNRKQDL